jgi:tRNA-2-methylthio-N6-dimethylallyladenosine synthase
LKTFRIITYGCQMNERDSETMAGLLSQAGYTEAPTDEDPDVAVFNTCCVREGAERRIFGKVQEYRKAKERRPGMVIAVVGCLSQQPGAALRVRKALPHVDIVLGTHNMPRLVEAIEAQAECGAPLVEVWDAEKEITEGLPSRRVPGVSAWVTIMYGCDNFCSYCIVPYVRGRERSREPDEVIAEVEGLAAVGYGEVVLLGQNVNSYGKTLGRPFDFADLLERLDQTEGLSRIRYMTSHPRDFSQKMIDTVRRLPKVCEHFHLPVQSGSNSVLSRMNRGYTREQYFDLIQRIRLAVPESSITTDVIVGFPGETEDDFADTLDLVRTLEFDAAFTFIYSARTGTAATKMTPEVPEETKHGRIAELIGLQNSITKSKMRAAIGNVLEVLVEGPSERDPQKWSGRTRQNKMVHFAGDEISRGVTVPIRIVGAGTWTLRGEVVGEA